MKQVGFFILFVFSIQLTAYAQDSTFENYFINKTLRFDYSRAGDKDSTWIVVEQLKMEDFWGGSHTKLIDSLNLGDYYYYVYDSASNQLLYSRGYSSLYREWLDTDEATKLKRSFYESIVMPFPKKTIRLVLKDRDKKNNFQSVFQIYISPDNYFIKKEQKLPYTVKDIHVKEKTEKALDIVILAEGYTQEEMPKFDKDCKRFMGYFFNVSPFKELKSKINFRIIESPSLESGTDIPGQSIWKNTILNTHFYTFNSERYLTTLDIKSVRDIAACAPYDQIIILVNTSKYGGGGIYNYYNLCSSDNMYSKQVFTHEFGHGFGALADEYEYGADSAEAIYDMSVELWQPNITNLVDFDKKWKNMCDSVSIPTPDIPENYNKIGAFEGAGYVLKKIYRPTHDCKMRSNKTDEFCPVCKNILLKVLSYYTK